MPTVTLANVCAPLSGPPDVTNAFIGNAVSPTAGLSMNTNYFYSVPLTTGSLTPTNALDAIFTFKYIESLPIPTYPGTIPNLSTSNPLIVGDARLRVLSSTTRQGTNDIIAFFPGGVVRKDAMFYLLTLPTPTPGVTALASLGTSLNTAITTVNVTTAYYVRTSAWAMSNATTTYFVRTTDIGGEKFFLLNNSTGGETNVNLPTANLTSGRFSFSVATSIGASGIVSSITLPTISPVFGTALTLDSASSNSTISWNGNTYTAITTAPTQDQLQMNLAYERANVEFNILQISSITVNLNASQAVALAASPAAGEAAITVSTVVAAGTIVPGQRLRNIQPVTREAPTVTVTLQSPTSSPAGTTPSYITMSYYGILGTDGTGLAPVINESYFSFGATKYNKGYFAFIDSSVVSGENSYTMTTGDFTKYCELTTTAFSSTASASEVLNLLTSSSPSSPGQAFATRPGVWYIETISDGSSNFKLRYKAKDAADGTPAADLYLCGYFDINPSATTGISWKGSTDTNLATIFTCIKCSPLNGYCMPLATSDLEYSSYVTLKTLTYINGFGNVEMVFPSLTLIPGTKMNLSNGNSGVITATTNNTISFDDTDPGNSTFQDTFAYDPTLDSLAGGSGRYYNKLTSITIPNSIAYSDQTMINFKFTGRLVTAGIETPIYRAISLPGRVIAPGVVITYKEIDSMSATTTVVSVNNTGTTPSFICDNKMQFTFKAFAATGNGLTLSVAPGATTAQANAITSNILVGVTGGFFPWVSGSI